MSIPRTTLCYISQGDNWLFIRKSRKDDPNQGKYLGIGGHIEEGETPDECMIREIFEETGLTKDDLINLRRMGIIDFESDIWGKEEMNVYLADLKDGRDPTSYECDEGCLMWIRKTDAFDLPMWEGDRIMFRKLLMEERFHMSMRYEGETLVETEEKQYL